MADGGGPPRTGAAALGDDRAATARRPLSARRHHPVGHDRNRGSPSAAAVDVEGDWLVAMREGRGTRSGPVGRTLERRCIAAISRSRTCPRTCQPGFPRPASRRRFWPASFISHARLVAETTGMSPIMLMDEIAAHLDAERRAALFDF